MPVREASWLVSRGALLVDVRERDEFTTGTLPDAVNLPLSELPHRFRELDADRPIALVCRSGNRSREAAELLTARGFRDVVDLAGGIQATRIAA